jgi:hypothetical protein
MPLLRVFIGTAPIIELIVASALAQRELRLNVGELIRILGKPEKFTGYGACKVEPVHEYELPAVKPITGKIELLVSVKVNTLVKVNINVLVIELKVNNQPAPIIEYQVVIKLFTL